MFLHYSSIAQNEFCLKPHSLSCCGLEVSFLSPQTRQLRVDATRMGIFG